MLNPAVLLIDVYTVYGHLAWSTCFLCYVQSSVFPSCALSTWVDVAANALWRGTM